MIDQKIYILLTDTGTLFTRMIKLYTKKPFNHASISFDPHLTEVYSFGRKAARNPFIGGFVKENIRSKLFTKAKCALISCSVTHSQLQDLHEYIQKIELEKDLYRYNLLGLAAVTINKQMNRKNAFFCSQFVATVLQECQVAHFTKPLSLVTPHDFLEHTNFQLIYQGSIEAFCQENDIQSFEKSTYITAKQLIY